MKKVLIALTGIFIGSSSFVKAQNSLGIDSSNYVIPTTVSYNSSATFLVNVKNYGPQGFSGIADIVYAVDSVGNGFFLDTLTSNSRSFIIPVNSESPDSSSISIGSQFRSGINTVVIWPRTTNGGTPIVTHDSLKIQVLVTGFAGIPQLISNATRIYPNPTTRLLYVVSKFAIEQVRIFNDEGKTVLTERFSGTVDLGKLSTGMYTIEFTDPTGKKCFYKLMKE